MSKPNVVVIFPNSKYAKHNMSTDYLSNLLEVNVVNEAKCLDIIIDNKLSFQYHIKQLEEKLKLLK